VRFKSKFVQIENNMGAVKLLDKEITQYLSRLSTQQKEVVLSVVKTFAGEEAWWDDKEYIAEMDRRFAEMESGKIKSYTLEEMESGTRQAYKNRKRKK
jgi:hypothetical protein